MSGTPGVKGIETGRVVRGAAFMGRKDRSDKVLLRIDLPTLYAAESRRFALWLPVFLGLGIGQLGWKTQVGHVVAVFVRSGQGCLGMPCFMNEGRQRPRR